MRNRPHPKSRYLLSWVAILAVGFTLQGGPLHACACSESQQLPYSTPVLERSGYTVAYDGRTKTVLWAYEELTRESITGNIRRDQFRFSQDPDIPTIIQPDLEDYKGSGFDRGHLAPFADHKSSEVEARETFYLSNISPQVPQFNRGYWSKLEKHVRDLTGEYDRVCVVTGPLFLPQEMPDGKRYVTYQVIGPNDVAVPTHFFKVITAENACSKDQWAYQVPNEPIEGNPPLSDYEISVAKVERASGIVFRKSSSVP